MTAGWRLGAANPMTRVVAATLIFEAITAGLAIPALALGAGVDWLRAGVIGALAIVLPLLAAALLRRGVGWALLWLGQVAVLALGFLNPWALAACGLFVLLVATTVVLGRRLEQGA